MYGTRLVEFGAATGIAAGEYTAARDTDIYSEHITDQQTFMYDSEKGVISNSLEGELKHVDAVTWDIFGGDERSQRFFVNRVDFATKPFTQEDIGGYFGVGPGDSADYTDHRAWSLATQMKKNGLIDELVTAFYTCDPRHDYIRFGGFSRTDAHLKAGAAIRKIKTRDGDSWDVYLQEVLFNDHYVYQDDGSMTSKATHRNLLPEPGLPVIHLPLADFHSFSAQLLAQNANHPDIDRF